MHTCLNVFNTGVKLFKVFRVGIMNISDFGIDLLVQSRVQILTLKLKFIFQLIYLSHRSAKEIIHIQLEFFKSKFNIVLSNIFLMKL
mgnify:CR=1 FL=1